MKLEESWGVTFSKIAQKMDLVFSDSLNKQNLTSREYGILIFLTEVDSATQVKISEITSIDRTTTGQLIDKLESLGLVKRSQNLKDRRQNLIVITSSGILLVKKMWSEMQDIEKEVVENLSDIQKKILIMIAHSIERN